MKWQSYRSGNRDEESVVELVELVSVIPVYDVPREVSCTGSPCTVHNTQAVAVSAGLSR